MTGSDPTPKDLTWKEELADQIPAHLEEEISIFQTQIDLRKSGKLDEKIFAETRLRRGVYGQRYDNGMRHDGVEQKVLPFPCGDLHKGPDTKWDAPGMMRIKIPMGLLSATQMETMADLAEEYSDSILHVTTRQDIQLHFIHIDDTPALMRRLAAVNITTREACGNSVRNITACPRSGVCHDEGFDVTPYANALTYYLLGHKDVQDFGRKLKISFSGCLEHACGLANFHCIGLVASTREVNGTLEKGFKYYVGGGLGAVPRQAKLLDEFLPAEELLPVTQAICRLFGRLGEKQNRSRARLKFLVDKVGIEEFGRLVAEEREAIPRDERWTTLLEDLTVTDEHPKKPGAPLADGEQSAAFQTWRQSNVEKQRQANYSTVTIRLPLGDFSPGQARALTDIARRYTGDTIRATVEQNLMIRWVPDADLPAIFEDLRAADLGESGAGTISDITACPGTDTCKLGISASRGLAAVLEQRLMASGASQDPDLSTLRIKTSGCFNSCGQHHVADMGFLGVSRNVAGRRVAHFQLVVGGEWTRNGGSYGLAIGAYPSKRIPQVVDRLAGLWQEQAEPGERFKDFMKRIGRRPLRDALDDLREVPSYADDPSFYTDWGDAREYTIGDMGVGECAGEVVSFAEFGFARSERENFEAQLYLDASDAPRAAAQAYQAMLTSAKTLVQLELTDITDEPDEIVREFKSRYDDTKVFHDQYAKGKFAAYLFHWYQHPPTGESDHDQAHRLIEETQLFIEAARACHARIEERAMAGL